MLIVRLLDVGGQVTTNLLEPLFADQFGADLCQLLPIHDGIVFAVAALVGDPLVVAQELNSFVQVADGDAVWRVNGHENSQAHGQFVGRVHAKRLDVQVVVPDVLGLLQALASGVQQQLGTLDVGLVTQVQIVGPPHQAENLFGLLLLLLLTQLADCTCHVVVVDAVDHAKDVVLVEHLAELAHLYLLGCAVFGGFTKNT